jgi:hypothetical protein
MPGYPESPLPVLGTNEVRPIYSTPFPGQDSDVTRQAGTSVGMLGYSASLRFCARYNK